MFQKILDRSCVAFDYLEDHWESSLNHFLISSGLVFTFIVTSILSLLVHYDIIHLFKFTEQFQNPFFSIEVTFTLLLIAELFSLIFMLRKSVARSFGKQLELLALIYLRSGFKIFSHMDGSFEWATIKKEVYMMALVSIGALAIFIIQGFTYKLQRHISLTHTEDKKHEFIQLKKLLGLLLFIAFLLVGGRDLYVLLRDGYYLHSFNTFYTVLIYSDILIVLIALRYTLNFYKIFRYSAFVLATIFIRIALSLHGLQSVLIGVGTAIFILLMTFVYNYFVKDIVLNKGKGQKLRF